MGRIRGRKPSGTRLILWTSPQDRVTDAENRHRYKRNLSPKWHPGTRYATRKVALVQTSQVGRRNCVLVQDLNRDESGYTEYLGSISIAITIISIHTVLYWKCRPQYLGIKAVSSQ
eukprot:3341902-Rhodomonas_salina.2